MISISYRLVVVVSLSQCFFVEKCESNLIEYSTNGGIVDTRAGESLRKNRTLVSLRLEGVAGVKEVLPVVLALADNVALQVHSALRSLWNSISIDFFFLKNAIRRRCSFSTSAPTGSCAPTLRSSCCAGPWRATPTSRYHRHLDDFGCLR